MPKSNSQDEDKDGIDGHAVVDIDCFAESVERHQDADAIVAVDVIRATTMAVTAVALGRKCFPVPSLDAAIELYHKFWNPLLVGELGGFMPFGFHLNNSPVELVTLRNVDRPMILLSTSGTRLICSGKPSQATYVACLRNYQATSCGVAGRHRKVAIIGAGARGEFREEDQLCCAWIAEELIKRGFEPQDARTAEIVKRWSGAPVAEITCGASAEYLRRTNQTKDLDFILAHVGDLDGIYRLEHGEVIEECQRNDAGDGSRNGIR